MSMCVAVLTAGCASIPLPTDAPAGMPDVPELDVCVVWGERHERRLYEGVAELSFEPWNQASVSVVLKHQSGLVVLDPAFGVEIEDDLRRVPPWFRIITGSAKGKTPTVDGLEAAGLDPRAVKTVLLTHVHWDHTGGLRDLPKAKVLVAQADYDLVQSLEKYLDNGIMRHHFTRAWPRVTPFDFDGPPVLRFEASKDVLGDGSVIAVPLPGHSPGSTGYLVRGRGGKQWLFIGDTTWTVRGVEKPAHKMVPVIDLDRGRTAESIGRVHAVMNEHPEIIIVPAHDGAALETIPTCAR